MTGFHVDVEITVWCESIRPGCEFTARIVEPSDCLFYGGSGSTALEAIAWALDTYVSRRILGRSHRLARDPSERPGDNLTGAVAPAAQPVIAAAAAPSSSCSPIARPALVGDRDANPDNVIGCFERQIPTAPAPRLLGDPPPLTPRGRVAAQE